MNSWPLGVKTKALCISVSLTIVSCFLSWQPTFRSLWHSTGQISWLLVTVPGLAWEVKNQPYRNFLPVTYWGNNPGTGTEVLDIGDVSWFWGWKCISWRKVTHWDLKFFPCFLFNRNTITPASYLDLWGTYFCWCESPCILSAACSILYILECYKQDLPNFFGWKELLASVVLQPL